MMPRPPFTNSPDATSIQGNTTDVLLARVRSGDPRALDQLLSRLRPPLQRWAHGRLPSHARGLIDTDDLVQDTLLKTLRRLNEFRSTGEGALLAYLRATLINLIRDEVNRIRRRPLQVKLNENISQGGLAPSDPADSAEMELCFDQAMARLPEKHREAVFLRIELGYSFREVASAIGAPSEHAARMRVTRALVRLAEEMSDA